ncbi:hypothetical protein JXB41_03815 [Candidatus Woesearchaeota archaeon]|nr:hypothetical protein [Candidatus Woesearchaeota archaeon]
MEFVKQGILKKIAVGRSYLCSLNLKNEKAIVLLALNEINKRNVYLKQENNLNIEKIYEIKKRFKIYTILFSLNKLIFVLDYINDKDAIINQFPSVKKFDPIFFDKTAFHRELISNKTILEKHVIIYAFEKYYEIIQEIEEELFIKYSPLYTQKST